MSEFLASNYWQWRLLRTIVQGVLGASGSSSTLMDVDAMARAVIRGDYGYGEERKRRLGSYYSIMLRRVNEMLT